MEQFSGVIIPAVTPFDKDGTLRFDWLQENCARWNRTSVDGIMVLGSNGEFRSVDDDEAFEVIETASQTVSKDKKLIVGIGRESLRQTLTFLKRIASSALNINYVSVLTPCYFKNAMTDETLIAYYRAVANESPYPVLLYCAPGFANGVCISPQALQILSEHPNIVGIKDTSKDMMSAYLSSVDRNEHFSVISGSLSNIMTCLEQGGRAGVLSAANYFPESCAKLFTLMKTEGLETAKSYCTQLKTLVAQTGGRGGVAGVKATMGLMGYKGGYPRLPVLPCDSATVDTIQHCIENSKSLLSCEII